MACQHKKFEIDRKKKNNLTSAEEIVSWPVVRSRLLLRCSKCSEIVEGFLDGDVPVFKSTHLFRTRSKGRGKEEAKQGKL